MNTDKYKKELEKELTLLTKELRELGQQDPNNPNNWIAKSSNESKADDDHTDSNDNADDLEDLGERNAITSDLEIRFKNIKDALQRIKNETYGICEVCGEQIEDARLDANPAATMCIKHMEN